MNAPVDRSAWLAERRRGLGGSDMQHVFAEAPYGCPRRLYYDKIGEPQDFPENETAVMQRGTRLEDLVAELYAEETGRTIESRPAIVSEAHPWARVNVDRVIVGDERGPGALEIKTHGDWLFRRVKREGLLNAHVLQLQWALFVTGYSWGSYAVMHPDSWSLIYFDVPRDDVLIEAMVRAGGRFWRQVESRTPPDPLPEVDKRCRACPWRTRCRGAEIMAMHPAQPGESDLPLEQDDGLDPLLADYAEAQRMADEAEETVELIRQAIKAHMGDRRAAECHAGRVYYAPQTSQRIDTKLLRAKWPDIAKECSKPSVSRPLKIIPA